MPTPQQMHKKLNADWKTLTNTPNKRARLKKQLEQNYEVAKMNCNLAHKKFCQTGNPIHQQTMESQWQKAFYFLNALDRLKREERARAIRAEAKAEAKAEERARAEIQNATHH